MQTLCYSFLKEQEETLRTVQFYADQLVQQIKEESPDTDFSSIGPKSLLEGKIDEARAKEIRDSFPFEEWFARGLRDCILTEYQKAQDERDNKWSETINRIVADEDTIGEAMNKHIDSHPEIQVLPEEKLVTREKTLLDKLTEKLEEHPYVGKKEEICVMRRPSGEDDEAADFQHYFMIQTLLDYIYPYNVQIGERTKVKTRIQVGLTRKPEFFAFLDEIKESHSLEIESLGYMREVYNYRYALGELAIERRDLNSSQLNSTALWQDFTAKVNEKTSEVESKNGARKKSVIPI